MDSLFNQFLSDCNGQGSVHQITGNKLYDFSDNQQTLAPFMPQPSALNITMTVLTDLLSVLMARSLLPPRYRFRNP